MSVSEEDMFMNTSIISISNNQKNEAGKYACDECNYQASDKSNLNKHKIGIHLKVKYNCDSCDYTASQFKI